MATRRELKEAIGQRYRAAGGWERSQMLDEFTRVTGYHRKHALRVLHRPFVPQPPRPRKRIYNEAVRQALGVCNALKVIHFRAEKVIQPGSFYF